jgi:uracil-DNA glycosylase
MQNSIFKDIINPTWMDTFDQIDPDIRQITEDEYSTVKDKNDVFPSFKDIFSFTKYSNFEDNKVLIIGQDPFHGLYYNSNDKTYYPQATGLAFSVPTECKIPPSLANIYENMYRFGHLTTNPTHGNLENWAKQGVILMNTSLSVEKSKPNSHQSMWSMFTDELIREMTKKHPSLIIVLWGGNALSKMKIVSNKEKHHFIISSHPSPLGFKNKIKGYDSFYEKDHFKEINDILVSKGQQPIDWQIK